MPSKLLDDLINEFHQSASRHIAMGDVKGLRGVWSHFAAVARLGSKEKNADYSETEAKTAMLAELRQAFRTYADRVPRDFFKDI